jgi:hypothetical protein
MSVPVQGSWLFTQQAVGQVQERIHLVTLSSWSAAGTGEASEDSF